nr:FAD-binding protein [Dehalococcoidia bacterium]
MVSQSDRIEFFASFLDEGAILQGEDVSGRTAGGLHPEEKIQAKVILRPKTTEELSKILSACHESNQPIVVHGGLTGLVYGTRSTQDQLVISLERMNQIEDVDLIGRTITCQSG